MALRRSMPTRDPQRADTDRGQSREYDAKTGGWTKPADPKPSTPNGR